YEPQAYEENYASILALEKKSFSAARQIVVTTDEMRQTALQTHHLPPEKIRVIPNYINTERFCPPPSPMQRERPLITFVGRLTHQKNVENLLTAVAPLKHIDVEIFGSGELYEVLARRIHHENLSHVKLLGNIPNTALPQKFQQTTLYVQPSRYEGHPKTIFEAMSSGLPVVVGDAPGIRQFIQHGKTGWLCGETPDSIREGIETLLADAELRAKMGQAARQQVIDQFSLDKVVALELAMLEATLQQPAPPPQPTRRPILKSIGTYGQRLGVMARRKLGR
ncbi:MAG: glycosyltransferase family 4 protein, partial [Anaerolineae bacterium]|nr:glycosyltransferase family 4 protein [Anaerolineae bacterium]